MKVKKLKINIFWFNFKFLALTPLPFLNKINSSIPEISSNPISPNISTETNIKSIKLFISTIPQSSLLICILILFILFLILIIIILIFLIKKRRKFIETKTIVNNNIDINKMILRNEKNPNLKDFQALQNNSNTNDNSIIENNISFNQLKTKNLKEEIHCIVSETLSEMSLNKAKKIKKNKKGGKLKRKSGSGQLQIKIEANNENSKKELNQENKGNN